jgi:transcriptional regulator with AAA-type ATPase domain
MRDRATLLSWHSVGGGVEVLGNALALLREREVHIRRVVYLVEERFTIDPDSLHAQAGRAEVEVLPMPLEDPTRHEIVYSLVRDLVLAKVRGCTALHINVSPGTPAMHAVWLILHAAGAFPAGTRLWSSQVDKRSRTTRIDPVEFEIRTYLAEIRRIERDRPERAAYDPEPRSPARRAALDMLRRFARVPGAPLLILGERGTGKTTLVETYLAPLKQRSLVALACGTLDGADARMAESELFGHVKGAFTGADRAREGLVAGADKGVLLLDEVQDLPKPLQRKLVRLLQDERRRYRPVGADEEREADVDVVCASNLPLEMLRKKLDADLFDRISLLTVHVPPLRECREDLPDDYRRVWRSLRRDRSQPDEAPTPRPLLEALLSAPLAGNLRDLQRIALLVMAYWPELGEAAITPALAAWRDRADAPPRLDTDMGEGTRTARVIAFRRRLAIWAKERWKTWEQAARALACDEATLRKDATRRGRSARSVTPRPRRSG